MAHSDQTVIATQSQNGFYTDLTRRLQYSQNISLISQEELVKVSPNLNQMKAFHNIILLRQAVGRCRCLCSSGVLVLLHTIFNFMKHIVNRNPYLIWDEKPFSPGRVRIEYKMGLLYKLENSNMKSQFYVMK